MYGFDEECGVGPASGLCEGNAKSDKIQQIKQRLLARFAQDEEAETLPDTDAIELELEDELGISAGELEWLLDVSIEL